MFQLFTIIYNMTLERYASDVGIEICSIRMRRLRKDYGKYSVNFPCVNIVNPPLIAFVKHYVLYILH